MVVVGGGVTGVEFAGELQDFFEEDIRKLVLDISDRFRVTLVEALPNALPSFFKQLIDYTESTFKEEKINVWTKTMVKRVTDKTVKAHHFIIPRTCRHKHLQHHVIERPLYIVLILDDTLKDLRCGVRADTSPRQVAVCALKKKPPTTKKPTPEAEEEEEWWNCPVCSRPWAADERRFNEQH